MIRAVLAYSTSGLQPAISISRVFGDGQSEDLEASCRPLRGQGSDSGPTSPTAASRTDRAAEMHEKQGWGGVSLSTDFLLNGHCPIDDRMAASREAQHVQSWPSLHPCVGPL